MRRKDNRRYPPRPIIGVGALILRRNSILLVERGREPLKGYWSIPGGALETGERIHEGVSREVREETGLEVAPLSLVAVFERILSDKRGRPEYHYVLLDYLCKVTGGALCAGDDACRVAWVPKRHVASYRLTEGTGAVIEKAFAARR
ncbi:MAG: NUDIX hydrolase [Bryobacteraceae bacterium]